MTLYYTNAQVVVKFKLIVTVVLKSLKELLTNLIIGIYFCQAAPAAEDDDDLDLFGDETEEDKKAAEEREASKKPAKKKESKLSF